MRQRILAVSLLTLVAMQVKQPALILLATGLIVGFQTDSRKRIVVFILLSLIVLRLNLPVSSTGFREGVVVEINPSSIVVQHYLDRVLIRVEDPSIYHAFDRVVIDEEFKPIVSRVGDFGFDAQLWARANRIQGTVDESSIVRFCRQSILHDLFSGGVAHHDTVFVSAWRDLIYDTMQDPSITGFISLGLQFSLFLSLMHRLTQRIRQKEVAELVTFGSLCLFSSLFAFPLTALRFIFFHLSSRLCKDRHLSFSMNVLFFFFYEPATLTQWTLLIPLVYQATTLLVHKQRRLLVRTAVIALVFLRSNAVVDPFALLLFPIFRALFMLVSCLFWASLLLPNLSYISTLVYRSVESLLNRLPIETVSITGTIPDFFLFASLFLLITLSFHRRFRYLFIPILLIAPFRMYFNPFPSVVFLNAAQGDAMLVRSSFARCTVILDTGPPYEERTLLATLRSKSVSVVDAMIITHADADHRGNMNRFSQAFKIKDIVTKRKDVECDGLSLKNLDPGVVFDDENADSLVYATSLNGVRFLFMADADTRSEERILNRYDLTTDVVKLGHHGSQTSSSEVFIGRIKAKFAIISVGKNNYGHPSQTILQRLDAFRLDFSTTREEGDITFTLIGGYALITSSDGMIQIRKFIE